MLRLVWPPPRRLESSCRTKRGRKSVEEASFEKIRRRFEARMFRQIRNGRSTFSMWAPAVGRAYSAFGNCSLPRSSITSDSTLTEFHDVDFIPGNPFCRQEIESESFDLVISGSMLEHNPYFWITVAEIARVMAQDGLAVLIAPSTGHPHRYPLDCWRFYPDSWSAMCTYVGLELVETYREPLSWRKTVPGTYWREAMMVARKHPFGDEHARADFYRRIDAIVATRTELPNPELSRRPGGPAATRYSRSTLCRRKRWQFGPST